MSFKKIVIGAFVVLGVIFLLGLLQAMFAGFSQTAAPNAAFQRGKCTAECEKGNLSANCDSYCTEQLTEERLKQ